MSYILNLNDIINLLPIIFEYFAPGYLFLNVFYYLTSRKLPKNILVGSIAISYILKAVYLIFINNRIGVEFLSYWSFRALILCLVSLSFSIICVLITENRKFNKFFMNINHKSLHNDVFSDIVDYKNGTTLRVRCEDCDYIGKLLCYEEKDKNSWIVLTNYIIQNDDDEFDSSNMLFPSAMMIKLSDIKRIELYYSKDNDIL